MCMECTGFVMAGKLISKWLKTFELFLSLTSPPAPTELPSKMPGLSASFITLTAGWLVILTSRIKGYTYRYVIGICIWADVNRTMYLHLCHIRLFRQIILQYLWETMGQTSLHRQNWLDASGQNTQKMVQLRYVPAKRDTSYANAS